MLPKEDFANKAILVKVLTKGERIKNLKKLTTSFMNDPFLSNSKDFPLHVAKKYNVMNDRGGGRGFPLFINFNKYFFKIHT